MSLNLIKLSLTFFTLLACNPASISSTENTEKTSSDTLVTSIKEQEIAILSILPGAYHTEQYLPLLQGKRIAIVANQTSVINDVHLVDSLQSLGIDIRLIFSPEHGFRGDHDAGKKVANGIDERSGIKTYSLYGNTKKPSKQSLDSIDLVLFDIQDVGARFYTYISTLHYVMEACAEHVVPLIVLDRPNPNAHYVDGPVLQPAQKSFVGLHPVPVVYGMSIGEYAQMINGEKWLKNEAICSLTVIKNRNWTHNSVYRLAIPPSPNLSNQLSIYLYPSLCFFEGTAISVGRGTETPFQLYGHPKYQDSSYFFTPVSVVGKSVNPPLENQKCYGVNLSLLNEDSLRLQKKLDLTFLIDAYQKTPIEPFFTSPSFFNLLAGNKELLSQVKEGINQDSIRHSWKNDLDRFLKIREKYLLYP